MLVVVTLWIAFLDPRSWRPPRRPGRGASLTSAIGGTRSSTSRISRASGALATRPSLVAGGRGAVLPGLAAAPHPGHPIPAAALAAGRHRGRGRGRLRLGDGHDLPAGQRSHPCLRGHGHRAFQLLIGASLALVWPSRRLTGPISALRRRGLDALGASGWPSSSSMLVDTNEYETFLYRGGMVILSLATVAWSPCSPIRRRTSAGFSVPRPCAGSGCGPTASTSGTTRSSCSPLRWTAPPARC